MKKSLFLLVMVVCLAIPLTSNAQFYHQRWEFSLGGSGNSDRDFDTSVFSTEMSLGYFFTERLEIIFRQGIGYFDTKGGKDSLNGSSRAGLDIHFKLGKLMPYIGATMGYVYGDSVTESYIAGPEGGLKFFVNSTTFINGMIAYDFFFEDTDEAEAAFDDGRFVYALSIGFRF